MMNTANVTATTINTAAGTTATTIMKTNSQQAALSLQTSGIIPAAIIATNDRLSTANNVAHNSIAALQNHESTNANSTTSTAPQPVTAFTLHAPAQALQALPNNLAAISAVTSATSSVPPTAQIQAMPTANTSIIHPATIGLSSSTSATLTSVVGTGASILPVSGQQVNAIPVGVAGPTVLKAQPQVTALPISAQRFQATANVMTSSAAATAAPNSLFIPHETHVPAAAAKNLSVTLSSAPNAHHQTIIQTNSVISVTAAGPTVTVHQQIPSAHSSGAQQPLFIQTSNPTASSAILHTNVAPSGPTNSSVLNAANLSTINLSTSAAHHQPAPAPPPPQQQQPPQQPTTPQQPPQQPQQPQPQQQQSQPTVITQQSGPTTQQQQQQQNQQFQRLKVEDALSYLDQVKYKFNDQPQVYNDFLDIMKEFKSQSIDTPGVIQRVSNLFRGHPELIVGFNTFLPPGYKIEIHANEVNVSMPNSTNFTTPLGGPIGVATSTIVSGPGVSQQQQPSNSGSSNRSSAASTMNLFQSISQTNSVASRETNSTLVNNVAASGSRGADSHTVNRSSSQGEAASSNSRAPNDSSQRSSHGSTLTPPVEFNHAINYVNKIKNRFSSQPEVYKQFLDILQSYQKEQRVKGEGSNGQKSIGESEVYAKVAQLFQKQDDLLKEFSQFLPDATGGGSIGGAGGGGGSGGAHSSLNSNFLLATPSHGNNAHNCVGNSTANSFTHLNMTTPGTPPTVALSHGSGHHAEGASRVDGIASSLYNNSNNNSNNALANTDHSALIKKQPVGLANSNPPLKNARALDSGHSPNAIANNVRVPKRLPTNLIPSGSVDVCSVPNKRSKMLHVRDAGHSEASNKYVGELAEYALFDKLRKHLNRYQYDNFLKCLVVYNNGVISRTELFQLVSKPIFDGHPDLLKRFKDLWGMKSGELGDGKQETNGPNSTPSISGSYYNNLSYNSPYANNYQLEGLSNRLVMMKDRANWDSGEHVIEHDVGTYKRYGISYRALPANPSEAQKCSGRLNDEICKQVLNDTYVSFPSWSEDSSFVSSRKTQYEEHIYRTEDERFELDHVIETNASCIQLFDTVLKRMTNMTEEEKYNFVLDENLYGRSCVIYKKAIRRLYGEKFDNVFLALKTNPQKVIPVILSRLIAKDEEWREMQKNFNRTWRDQLEKFYLKSLDHQGINFKTNDSKGLRNKVLLTDIEAIRDERQKQEQEKQQEPAAAATGESASVPAVVNAQPHMIQVYPDKAMIDVACNLIIHHVKRQTSTHKEDKQKIKQLMRHFIPDLFATRRGELSDDECEDEEEPMDVQETEGPKSANSPDDKEKSVANEPEKQDEQPTAEPLPPAQPANLLNSDPDDTYALYLVNDYWYYFFRLHHILCDRLSKMNKHALEIAAEEAAQNVNKEESPSNKLRLKNTIDYEVDEYFSTLVDMVKQLLDGNLDSNTYEDTLREMFGIHAYHAFTMDKLVQYCVRNLQHIVGDEVSMQCYELFLDASKTGSAGGSCKTAHERAEKEATYQRNAEELMSDELSFKLFVYKNEGKVTIDLIGSNEEDNDSPNDGDDDHPTSQSVRTLRSTAKNSKFDKWDNPEAYNAMIEERLRDNPRWLERIVRNAKSTVAETNQESRDTENETAEKTADEEPASSEENSNQEGSSRGPEVKHLALDKYKSVILANNRHLYRRNALKKARRKHQLVTSKKFEKFNKLHTTWLEDFVSEDLGSKCDSWLLSSNVQANDSETEQAIRDTTSALVALAELPVVSATSTSDKSSSSSSNGSEAKASSSSTALHKKMHRVTIEDDSHTPYRPYCKYVFQ